MFSGGRSMTFAQAAQKAIELGGKFDGHEAPEDVNAFTKRSLAGLAGQGLIAVAKDAYPRDGQTQSYTVGFAEVEVDVETGHYEILEFTAIADVGTVMNPRSLRGQTFGGIMLGIGHAICQKWVYDQHYGVPLAKRFHYNKPPTILDAPLNFKWDAVGLADPETPVGARGIGEPPVGAGYGAIMNALVAAVGPDDVPSVARHRGRHSRVARSWQGCARTADGTHLVENGGARKSGLERGSVPGFLIGQF